MRISSSILCSALLLAACGDLGGGGDAGPPPGLAVLGQGTHDIAMVDVEVLATSADLLSTPRDLEFNPADPTQLWIVNRNTAFTILFDIGLPTQRAERHAAPGTTHFLAKPAALAFGDNGLLATAPEEDQPTQGPATPADFMGPSLWTADLTIFDGGHSSHMDMLHNSPNSAGIAWERDNVYWIFDGAHRALTRYDFQDDHGPGGADHSDGIVSRFAEGQVAYVPRVPSHMVFHGGLLYIADTGNARIAVLDPSTATTGAPMGPNYDGTDQHSMIGGDLTTLIDGAAIGLVRPSGLAIDGDLLFVTDNETSIISVFDLNTTDLIDYLYVSSEVAAGGLMGIEIDAEGRVLLVDALNDRILRISPPAAPLEI